MSEENKYIFLLPVPDDEPIEFSRPEVEDILRNKLGYTGLENKSFSGDIYYINLDNKRMLMMYNTPENQNMLSTYNQLLYDKKFDPDNKLKFVKEDGTEDNLMTAYTGNGDYTTLYDAYMLIAEEDKTIQIFDDFSDDEEGGEGAGGGGGDVPKLHFEPYKDNFAIIDENNRLRRSLQVGELMDALYSVCNPIPSVTIMNNKIFITDKFEESGKISYPEEEITIVDNYLLDFTQLTTSYVLISSLPLSTYEIKTFVFYFKPTEDNSKEALFSYGNGIEFYIENNRIYLKLGIKDISIIPLRHKILSSVAIEEPYENKITFTFWYRTDIPLDKSCAQTVFLRNHDNTLQIIQFMGTGEVQMLYLGSPLALPELTRPKNLLANKWYFFVISYDGTTGTFNYWIRSDFDANPPYEHYASTVLDSSTRDAFNELYFPVFEHGYYSYNYGTDNSTIYTDEEEISYQFIDSNDKLLEIWNLHKGDDIFTINKVNEIGVSFDTDLSKIYVFKDDIITESTFADIYPSIKDLNNQIQIGKVETISNLNNSYIGSIFFSNKVAKTFGQFTAVRVGCQRIEQTLDPATFVKDITTLSNKIPAFRADKKSLVETDITYEDLKNIYYTYNFTPYISTEDNEFQLKNQFKNGIITSYPNKTEIILNNNLLDFTGSDIDYIVISSLPLEGFNFRTFFFQFKVTEIVSKEALVAYGINAQNYVEFYKNKNYVVCTMYKNKTPYNFYLNFEPDSTLPLFWYNIGYTFSDHNIGSNTIDNIIDRVGGTLSTNLLYNMANQTISLANGINQINSSSPYNLTIATWFCNYGNEVKIYLNGVLGLGSKNMANRYFGLTTFDRLALMAGAGTTRISLKTSWVPTAQSDLYGRWIFVAISYNGDDGTINWVIKDDTQTVANYEETYTLTEIERNSFNNDFFSNSDPLKLDVNLNALYLIEDIYIYNSYLNISELQSIFNRQRIVDQLLLNPIIPNQLNTIGISFDTINNQTIHYVNNNCFAIPHHDPLGDKFIDFTQLDDKIQIGKLVSDTTNLNTSFIGSFYVSGEICKTTEAFDALRKGRQRVEKILDQDQIVENNNPTNNILTISSDNYIYKTNKTYADIGNNGGGGMIGGTTVISEDNTVTNKLLAVDRDDNIVKINKTYADVIDLKNLIENNTSTNNLLAVDGNNNIVKVNKTYADIINPSSFMENNTSSNKIIMLTSNNQLVKTNKTYYDIGRVNWSDQNLKTNIAEITYSLNDVLSLRPISFNWSTEHVITSKFISGEPEMRKHFGLIAQDVEKIIPEIVGENEGYKTIDYPSLIPLLIKVIQEQNKTIEKLNSDMTIIKGKLGIK